MIKAEGLSKTYRVKQKKHFYSRASIKHVEAVKKVDIEIDEGKLIGLLGINGAGKTTVIKMLATLLAPTSGSISIDGINAIADPRPIKRIVNMITGGERNIYWRLTGRENLNYFSKLYGYDNKTSHDMVEKILAIVDLADAADQPVEQYSKGMKQRLQIARGLINDPKYVFLDEPTLGLDIVIAKELRAYIKKLALQEKKGILLTTHYIAEAEELCDYIYIIHHGEIIAQGCPDDLKSRYGQKYRVLFEVDFISDLLKDALRAMLDNNIICTLDIDEVVKTIEITGVNDFLERSLAEIQKSTSSLKRFQVYEQSLEDAVFALLQEG